MKLKLTKTNIDRITPPAIGTDLYWDDDLTGFGIRVSGSRKTYIAQSRVRGTGRQIRIALGLHGRLTPAQARHEAKTALGDMERGIDRRLAQRRERLAGITLTTAYEAYTASKALSDKTRRDYERAMHVACAPWHSLPLAKITGGMVHDRFEEVSKMGPVQANQMFRFLRALLGWSMWRYVNDDGTPLMPANPCQILTKLNRWNPVRRRDRHVAQHQLHQFMRAIQNDAHDRAQLRDTKDLCALLILTGLREQEGCRLRREDVDLDRRLITVRHTKNGKDHTLPIGPWLAERLQERLVGATTSTYIFPAETASGHLQYHRKHVLAIVQASGVEFRLHDLRRTFATIVNHHLERSLSAYTIKRLLNHSISGDVTAGYVQHPVESLREPMQLVENFVLRSAGMLPGIAASPLRQAA
jgi:integrase